MKVLVVESDNMSRRIVQRTVEQAGHACLVAADGLQAWALMQAEQVDVVISSWRLPGLNGLELCRLVRARDVPRYTYFIFLTSLEDRQHILAGMEAGADYHLVKPLKPEQLILLLGQAARLTTLQRQWHERYVGCEQLIDRLAAQARTDPLTQLGNRLRLQEHLELLQGRAARYGHSFCAAMYDIDGFKSYNDSFGHTAGDEVLVQLADLTRRVFRSGDGLFRYGGDEFLVILPEQTLASAMIAVERQRREFEALAIPQAVPGSAPVLTLSAGVAEMAPHENEPVEALITEADAALYRAKAAGGNCVVTFSPISEA
jgi:two-component system, cell cycle response regulator